MKIYEGYQIKPQKEVPTCYVIAYDGKGGSIPNALDGLFTSPSLAVQAIDRYLQSKVKKV